MKKYIFNLILTLSLSSCLNGLSLEQRVQELESQLGGLEKKVEGLEKQLGGIKSLVTNTLEEELVDRYGMIRRCPMPQVEHGRASCSAKDRVPGTYCSAECFAGYAPSLRDRVTCQEKVGTWTDQLRCEPEKSLIVVSGGSDIASVEIIDFHNSTGCNLNIPDMPLTKHGEVRFMHNMFYLPRSVYVWKSDTWKYSFHLLVCNGLSQSPNASCDSWTLGDSEWKHHSYPHIEEYDQMLGYLDKEHRLFKEEKYHFSRSGRYAASSYSWDRHNFIVGGMLSEGNNHYPTNTSRGFQGSKLPSTQRVLPYSQRNVKLEDRKYTYKTKEVFWDKDYRHMQTARSLFCIARYRHNDFVAIGGHSGKIEKSAEFLEYKQHPDQQMPDMETARNGHACVGITGDDDAAKIVVSGGSDNTHRSGAKALKSSEMYSSDTDEWEQVGDMVNTRFRHALVNTGGRIIAFGGKEWNPDVPLKTAEEFDVSTKTWRSLGDVMSVPRANFGYVTIPHAAIPGCTPN